MEPIRRQAGRREASDVKPCAGIMLRLRGVLAEPSGSADDPYRRVILRPVPDAEAAATQGGAILDLPPLDPAEACREAVAAALQQFRAVHGSGPEFVRLRPLGTVAVAWSDAVDGPPLRNKIALVTGAAGAIGAGICRGLLAAGCHLAAADIAEAALEGLVRELAPEAPDRITGIRMDVTDPASVAAGFDELIAAWGGVDIIVVNAGVAMVASLVELDLEAFRRLERVNVEGTLLTLAEAGRRLREQGTGGDIVVVSTKNVFAPGAQFGAYSATKAASHQLARIASLEMAPLGVRVNLVAPDAVFGDGAHRSGLWAEVGPSRMRARGLDEKGLEEYYRSRNLLKVRVTAEHVANAVLFFVTRQTPTTGATLPVDGGLPDATPR
jgi:NAD(P)-dependent dehydrogenase (short-subunit alcohol dehydrogenase family)